MQSETLASELTFLIDGMIGTSNSAPVIGISGPQGSGKSTALAHVLKHSSFKIAGLGLDDFYLPKAERQRLSKDISPLFETRGPPGTHDLSLLSSTLDHLLSATSQTECLIPKFDKPKDDRCPLKDWYRFMGRPDAIIIEGWMVGATLPPDFLSSAPLNEIEDKDKDGAWRRAQHENLSGPYADLWDRIDHFIHITGPGFEAVNTWRLEQEATNLNTEISELSEARREWVSTFVQYFERLTHSMHEEHTRPGSVLRINLAREYVGGS